MQARWKPVLVGAFGALLLVGCSSSGSDPAADGSSPPLPPIADGIGPRVTVTGHLEGVGGPVARAMHWPGTIHVRGPVHLDVTTDSHGHFRLRVPPGRYVLTGHSPQYGDGSYLCRSVRSLVVTTGAPVRMDVICQMK